jgi:hypothetical protein
MPGNPEDGHGDHPKDEPVEQGQGLVALGHLRNSRLKWKNCVPPATLQRVGNALKTSLANLLGQKKTAVAAVIQEGVGISFTRTMKKGASRHPRTSKWPGWKQLIKRSRYL